jgi:hypothetical protein
MGLATRLVTGTTEHLPVKEGGDGVPAVGIFDSGWK